MKKIVSMLSVTVRSSIYKILLILIGMAALQIGMFYHTYQRFDFSGLEDTEKLGNAWGVTWTLESLVEKSNVEFVFLAAFVLTCIVLVWAQSERRGTNSYYFYDRLTISGRQRYTAWAVYNICCILLLVFAEFLTVLGMGAIFEYLVPQEYESVQMFFMAFYKSEFLHSLLPMADVIKWIRNILLFTAVGMEIAGLAYLRRKPWPLFMMMVWIILWFSTGFENYPIDIFCSVYFAVSIGINVYKVFISERMAD